MEIGAGKGKLKTALRGIEMQEIWVGPGEEGIRGPEREG